MFMMRNYGLSRAICSAKQDDGGDGGGGDGTPKPLDEEAIKKLVTESVTAAIGPAVAGAVSNHFKRGAVKELIDNAVKTGIEALKPAGGDDDDDGGDDKDKGKTKGKPDPETAKALKALQAQNATLQKQVEAEKAEREAAKAASARGEERGALEKALRAAGVGDSHVPAAAALLIHDQKRVKRNDDGAICFEMTRDWGAELVPIEKGVTEWAATDAGKVYLPPSDAGGSGNRGGNRPGEKVDKSQAAKKTAMGVLGDFMLGK